MIRSVLMAANDVPTAYTSRDQYEQNRWVQHRHAITIHAADAPTACKVTPPHRLILRRY
jgi:hypothetical protein